VREKSIFTVFACLLLFAAMLPLHAKAACKEKLAEIDVRIADPAVTANNRNAVTMFRDQAASACDQGHDAAAMQQLSMIELMLPPPQAQVEAQQQADADTKTPLTNDFLAGTWCSMTPQGSEQSQLIFARDGTLEACLHDTVYGRYGACSNAGRTADWLDRYDRAEIVEQDRIIMSGGQSARGGQSEYRRGECSAHGL